MGIRADLRRLCSLTLTSEHNSFNDVLAHFHQETGVKHHTTIPYSQGRKWDSASTEGILNTLVKQTLGVSPDTLLLGSIFSTVPSLLTQIDLDVSFVQPRLIRDFVVTLIARHANLIDEVIHSQTAMNEANLRKRYSSYARIPKLKQRVQRYYGADIYSIHIDYETQT